MNKPYLRRLASLLENFNEERKKLVQPVKKFDMNTWHCGSAACALGSAMLHPYFRKRGLTDSPDTWNDDSSEPKFDGATDFGAGAKFFDITIDESYYLFDSFEYDAHNPRPQTVAKRIRELVAHGGKPNAE